MASTFALLVLVVILALVFDYINGFHDTANAVATVVSTNVLPGRTAVLMAAVFNFVGAFTGVGVAKTIGGDIANPATITQTVVAAALLGAIFWNLLTWYYGIPSSSSHALIGGIVGAVWCHEVLDGDAAGEALAALVTSKGVLLALQALVLSPLCGLDRRLRAHDRALVDGAAVASRQSVNRAFRVLATRLGRLHGLRPRLQRRAEVDGHHRHGAGGLCRGPLDGRGQGRAGADVGDHQLRDGDGAGHGVGRLADHEDDGPQDHPLAADQRLRRRDRRRHVSFWWPVVCRPP